MGLAKLPARPMVNEPPKLVISMIIQQRLTVISRGVCKGLGYAGTVSSPSYTLVHEYPNDPPLYHLDLYRLTPPADLGEIGLDHYMEGDGVTLIEWPERLEKNTVGITHRVYVQILDGDDREITVETLNPQA